LLAVSQENGGLGNLDIVSLVSILSQLQGEYCAIVSLVSLVHLICLPLEKFNMVFYQKPFAGNNNSMEKPSGQSSLDGDQVIQLLNRMNFAFLSSQKVAAPSQGFDLNIAQSIQSPRADIPKANGNPSAGLTAELLAILSALTGPSHDALALLRNSLATNLNANIKPQHQTLPPPAPAPAPADA
jgi:hypothetical protein